MSDPEINLNDLYVKDLIEKINPRFFDWLQKILELNVSRALQISTYFTNFYIVQNYFPSFSSLLEAMPDLVKKKNLNPAKMKEFRTNFERIFTIIIFVLVHNIIILILNMMNLMLKNFFKTTMNF